MALRVTDNMRDEIDKALRGYIEGIKIRTKGNINSEAVTAEGFFRNLLNLLYDYKLTKDKIESANNETIDLHSVELKICVQVSAQNTKQKIETTVASFVKKEKYKIYEQLHFVILDREKDFDYDENSLLSQNVKIVFHDLTTIFSTLLNKFDSRESIEPIYHFIKGEFDENYQIVQKQITSDTENFEVEELKKLHIVDQIYSVLNQFEGLNTIYPRTIARLFPFNSSRRNYDVYSHYCLKTDNIEIHNLLECISVNDKKEILISDEKLRPYEAKIREIFLKLNHSLIRCICYREKYTEIKHHKINLIEYDENCNCNSCKYHKFKIKDLFTLIKEKAITPSADLSDAMNEGYYMAKVGEHVKAYQVFKKIEAESLINKKFIVNYIANHNLKKIRNFIDSPWLESERKTILPQIDGFELHDKLATYKLSKDVKEELMRLKEDYYLHYSREEIEDYIKKVTKIYHLYKGNGTHNGSSIAALIWEELHILHSFYIANSILIDDFYTFRETVTKGIEGLFISYATNNRYNERYKELDAFIFKLIVFYSEEEQLKSIFKNYNIDKIIISQKQVDPIVEVCLNFFSGQISKSSFAGVTFNDDLDKQEYFSHYRQNLRHYSNKILFMLAKVETNECYRKLTQPIIDFIIGSKDFNSGNWDYFVQFFRTHISIFSSSQLEELFENLFTNKENSLNSDVVLTICKIASEKFKFQITTPARFQKILNSISLKLADKFRKHDRELLIGLYLISEPSSKIIIKTKIIEYLNADFDPNLYESACFYDLFSKNEFPEFLEKYLDYSLAHCTEFDYKLENGKWIAQSYAGINSLICLAHLGVDFKHEKIQLISKKSDYYEWIINPDVFDYSKFQVCWLKSFLPYFMRDNIKTSGVLKLIVEEELRTNFDVELAKTYLNG